MTGAKRGHREPGITQLQSGNHRWRVWVTYPDGTRERLTGTARTRTEAQQAKRDALAEASAGRKPVARTLTVADMVTEYIAAKKATWAVRTLWNNEELYGRHVRPHIGHLKAAGLAPPTLRAYFERLKAAGLGHSGQRQIHVLLSGAYKHAIGDGVLRDNPMPYARPAPAADRGETKLKAFTHEEATKFFEAALRDRWALVLGFMAVTGIRIGEAVALTWGDLGQDPKRPDVSFAEIARTRSEFKGKAYESSPKTAAGRRRIYLSADAVGILRTMRRIVETEADAHGQGVGRYVFPSTDGRPLRQDTVRHVMKRICEEAGVPVLSPHKLRHTFTSVMHSQGLDVAALSAHLGHAQITTTLSFYRSVFDQERRGVTLNLSRPDVADTATPGAGWEAGTGKAGT
jgi:integrase